MNSDPICRTLTTLLKSKKNSYRNYATVLAVWNSDARAWSWTNGYYILGQGIVGESPAHLITLKDLEYKVIDGSPPFIPSEHTNRPDFRYPNVARVIETESKSSAVTLNIEYLQDAIKNIKALTSKGFVKMVITENQVKFETKDAWAVLCTVADDASDH